jgi:hypothetical protein
MTVTARYQRLIDAALAYRDAWRARKAFAEQFRDEPRIEQVFLRATAAQLDKNVNDTRENLERVGHKAAKRSVQTNNIWQEQKQWKGNRQ